MNNIGATALQTERLILREFTEKDIPALFSLLNDKEVNTFLPWFPVQSLTETREFYERRIATVYRQRQGYYYAICLKTDNIPIGYVNVSADDSRDLGYALQRAHQHKGIMTEAAAALIINLRADGVPYITATHDVNNPASGKVMQRIGMQYKYSYKEQWQPKNIPVIFRMYQLNLDGATDRVYKKYLSMSEEHFIEQDVL